MFTVRAPTERGHLIVLERGVTFGFFDLPMEFAIQAQAAPSEFRFEFVVKKTKGKADYLVEVTRETPDRARMIFHNPTEGGVSGLVNPTLIVAAAGRAVAFMFYVDVVRRSHGAYRLTYEFYEAPFAQDVAEASQ